jgi:hypothetical protein
MTTPAIGICTSASRETCNRIWEAMDRGPNTFSVRLTSDPEATWEDEPTHWAFYDDSATLVLSAAWTALTQGMLPTLATGYDWGVGDTPTTAAALAACGGSNLYIFTGSGANIDSAGLFRSIVTSGITDLPLYFHPAPPM